MYDPYTEWRNELEAWKFLTYLAEDKHGAALLRSEGDAKKAAQKVPIATICSGGGWNLILAELDKLYKKDLSASKFQALDQLVKHKHPSSMRLNNY